MSASQHRKPQGLAQRAPSCPSRDAAFPADSFFPVCFLFSIYTRDKKFCKLPLEFRHLSAGQVPWKHERDWHLFVAPSKMLQIEIKEGEEVPRTDAESETAPFDRASKIETRINFVQN